MCLRRQQFYCWLNNYTEFSSIQNFSHLQNAFYHMHLCKCFTCATAKVMDDILESKSDYDEEDLISQSIANLAFISICSIYLSTTKKSEAAQQLREYFAMYIARKKLQTSASAATTLQIIRATYRLSKSKIECDIS